MLASYCQVEPWRCDIATALFELGPLTCAAHGLAPEAKWGFGPIFGAYEERSRLDALDIFLLALEAAGRFCYAASIRPECSAQGLVIVMGKVSTANFNASQQGEINGLVLMPRRGVRTGVN